MGHEDGDRPKKRRKERAKRGKNHEAENQHSNVVEEDNAQQNDKLVSLLSVLRIYNILLHIHSSVDTYSSY